MAKHQLRRGGEAATRTAAFDALSRATSETLTLIGEPTASVSRTFDTLGRVESVTTTGPAGPVSASASFDLADLPLTQTLTALGAATTVTNTFAKTNQWQTTSAFDSIWTFTTSVDGPVRQMTSTLAAISRDYDERHRLTSVRTLAGTAAYANYTLAYDTRDRIGSVSASVAGQAGTDAYLYDAADRLTSWTRTGTGAAAETYEPLADGSLGKLHRGSVVTSFTYDADDRLTAVKEGSVTTAYGNDIYGRRVSRVSPSLATTYTWNASGQLGSVTTRASSGATTTAAYAYGISGMREAKTVVSSGITRTTSSVWSGMQLASERDSDGTRLRFLYGPGGIPLELSVTTAGGATTSYAYQLDSAGSVVALTNAAGVAVATYAYDPWGNATSVGGTDTWLANRQLRTSEALEAGVHRRTLYWMRDHRRLDALSRGVFHLASAPLPESLDIAAVMRRVPRAVLCLVSALAYHEIGTQIPHAVQIALPRQVRPPKFGYPRVQVFSMSDAALSVGVEEHMMGETRIHVFSVAKTIADCFKYRNRIGLDVAIEALQEVVRKRIVAPAQIMEAARVVRVESVIGPYLRALL